MAGINEMKFKIGRFFKNPHFLLLFSIIISYWGTILVNFQDEFSILLLFLVAVATIATRSMHSKPIKASSYALLSYVVFYLSFKNIEFSPYALALASIISYSEGRLFSYLFSSVSFVVFLSMLPHIEASMFYLVCIPAIVFAVGLGNAKTMKDALKRLLLSSIAYLLLLILFAEQSQYSLSIIAFFVAGAAIFVFERSIAQYKLKRTIEEDEIKYSSSEEQPRTA